MTVPEEMPTFVSTVRTVPEIAISGRDESPAKGSAQGKEIDVVLGEPIVDADEGETLATGLPDQHAVERIRVMRG